MITSTTDLLNEIISQTSSQSRQLHQPSKESTIDQKTTKEFAVRYACLQSRFLRCSWVEKVKFLTQMLQALTNISSLALILNTLMVSTTKAMLYEKSQCSTNFVYDRALNDHNRTLHEEILAETQKADIEWYKTLEDFQQILMIIGLVRLGGGSMPHQIYEEGIKLYQQRTSKAGTTSEHPDVIEIKPETPRVHYSYCNIIMDNTIAPSTSSHDQLPTYIPRNVNVKPDNIAELEKYDPKDPYVVEVEKKRKAWNDMLTKYRWQVEGKPSKAKEKKQNRPKSSSSSKSGKSSKKNKNQKSTSKGSTSGKASKSSKSKKGKKQGKDSDNVLDQIQLLPIWIVKRIFGYLDNETLKKAKKVNAYWGYAISDLQKELKTRKYLNKFISKMEVNIGQPPVQCASQETAPACEKTLKSDKPKKRLVKLSERGATLPQLKGKFTTPLSNKSLAIETVKQSLDDYLLPLEKLETFPRSIAKADPLYKVPPCIINELGFKSIFSVKTSKTSTDDDKEIYVANSSDNLSVSSYASDSIAAVEKEIRIIN